MTSVDLELSRSQVVTLVGVVQVEKKRLRNRGDDRAADGLGDIQSDLIRAAHREDPNA